MCGIVGCLSPDNNAVDIVLAGLEKLEYRGYDSAGISYMEGGRIQTAKQAGCVEDLIDKIPNKAFSGCCIGHTRWATHGKPSKRNAHPHTTMDGRLSIVHNGIIENYLAIKDELIDKGYKFKTETDTEVLLYLIYDYLIKECPDIYEATKLALERVVGAYAILVLDQTCTNTIVGARNGSPMVVGRNEDNFYIASDVGAFSEYADSEIELGTNTVVKIQKDKIDIYDMNSRTISACNIKKLHNQIFKIEKGDYDHFMQKEIFEQPNCLDNALSGRLEGYRVKLGGLLGYEKKISSSNHITIVACGTSWNAGLVAKYYIEEFCDIKVSVEYASEFRYRDPYIHPNDIVIGISQSGETADTIAALTLSKTKGAFVIGICNSVNSTMSRLTDCGIFLRAGMEIGVASTKAFTSQLMCLLLLALWIEQNSEKKKIELKTRLSIIDGLRGLSENVSNILGTTNKKIQNMAYAHKNVDRFLYIGRQYNYPVALEGALKMKELCYNSAEGFAAAELKHGPIALIDENTTVIALNSIMQKEQQLKMLNNMTEVKSRGANLIAIDCWNSMDCDANAYIKIDPVLSWLSPITTAIPLQLLAYYSAIAREKNVDKPRNLAKSVTVE